MIRKRSAWVAGAALAGTLAAVGSAQAIEIKVTIENLAPENGTFLTPVWVGFHDGTFDTYDGGQPASVPLGGDTLERLAEDGNTGPITEAFATSGVGNLDATIPGPGGPIGPGETAMQTFELDGSDALNRFFSYVSMVIPSNDAFIANGNPLAHQIFNEDGSFVGADFVVLGSDINDAGTEENTEAPLHTAFFGQVEPNTGNPGEGSVLAHPGFNDPGTGGDPGRPDVRERGLHHRRLSGRADHGDPCDPRAGHGAAECLWVGGAGDGAASPPCLSDRACFHSGRSRGSRHR